MKTLVLFTVLLVFAPTAEAKDLFYPVLNKLYSAEPNKCLKRSKQVIKLFPKTESAYYFAGKVSNDKAGKAKTAQQKYRLLLTAISYTQKFEQLADSSTKVAYEWGDLVLSMQTNLEETYVLLKNDENDKLSQNLSNKCPDFLRKTAVMESGDANSENKESVFKTDFTEKSVEIPINSDKNQLFGMPKGTENLTSYNLNHEKKLLLLINAERRKKGQDTLIWNEDLARACRYHATDLGTQNYFDHDSYDLVNGKLQKAGETFARIRKFYPHTFVNSENIAGGSSLPASTYEQWYKSPGHYRNMFNAESKQVGIGVVYVPNSTYGYYWVFCTAR